MSDMIVQGVTRRSEAQILISHNNLLNRKIVSNTLMFHQSDTSTITGLKNLLEGVKSHFTNIQIIQDVTNAIDAVVDGGSYCGVIKVNGSGFVSQKEIIYLRFQRTGENCSYQLYGASYIRNINKTNVRIGGVLLAVSTIALVTLLFPLAIPAAAAATIGVGGGVGVLAGTAFVVAGLDTGLEPEEASNVDEDLTGVLLGANLIRDDPANNRYVAVLAPRPQAPA